MVAEVLNNLRMSLEETGGRVVHNGLPVIRADRMQILQVFQNLIGNAIKFHGDGPPEVHVGARRDNGLWVFEVRDRGIGIEPDIIFFIFIKNNFFFLHQHYLFLRIRDNCFFRLFFYFTVPLFLEERQGLAPATNHTTKNFFFFIYFKKMV
ncbi:MAG: ATP-binding protein [Deltaproteobacteria bacterium]|nr:ATP-binding protein [Deltaproteobacteria bacterium]